MADAEDNPGVTESETNPFVALVTDDAKDRARWSERDENIQRRRLCERPAKKQKPYVGAPNFVVPIVDDTVRDKTDQEITMLLNSRVVAHCLSMDGAVDARTRGSIEVAFDTYLRYMIQVGPKLEEALDCKNARGWAIVKVWRNEYDRWGMLPDIEVPDPQDVILPVYAKREMQRADRICEIFRLSREEFRRMAGSNPTWKNVEDVIEANEKKNTNGGKLDTRGKMDATSDLVGLTASQDEGEVLLWEVWHYATEWTKRKAVEYWGPELGDRIIVGRKARVFFCPELAEQPVAIAPWREADEIEVATVAMMGADGMPAVDEMGQPVLQEVQTTRLGKDRGWPYVQCRYENRSKYFHDCRGAGQLVMDDQIAATATRNCKHTMMDYFQLPQFRGPQPRNGSNMTFEPGSFLPTDVERVDPVDPSASLDFTEDKFKREASKRAGVVGGYQYSEQVSSSRKIEKTATEIHAETARGDVVSTASVDRFAQPLGEIFQQLWDDLRRLKVKLPMLLGGAWLGFVGDEVYSADVLLVPAASSKTMSPDLQFMRDRELWATLAGFGQMGVVLDPEAAARDLVSHVDPQKLRWLGDPNKMGPQGQQPVYEQLKQLMMGQQAMGEQLAGLIEAVKATAKLADETAGVVEGAGKEHGGEE